LWGKKKKRPQHCDNHDLRKTYGLAASSYPSQLLDTLTAHLSQQVLYTQSHNSKATKIDYNCAKESIMPRIKEWHLRKMPTSFHSLCSLYCMNKGLLAGPITWMARPKWSQSCFCLWRVKTMPCDLKPWHQKRKMIYHDLPVISLLKQCFFLFVRLQYNKWCKQFKTMPMHFENTYLKIGYPLLNPLVCSHYPYQNSCSCNSPILRHSHLHITWHQVSCDDWCKDIPTAFDLTGAHSGCKYAAFHASLIENFPSLNGEWLGILLPDWIANTRPGSSHVRPSNANSPFRSGPRDWLGHRGCWWSASRP
jgi:hypothetical protein